MDELEQIIDMLDELQEESSVSKNVKMKLQSMKKELKDANKDNLSLAVNKILSDLEDLSGDINIPMFVRTQIWSITSLLETLS